MRALRLGFLSAGGWDTHRNQGNATGALANNLGNLASALVQLRRDFSQPNDVVAVVSEFGRTSAENGTSGTDHGHGNALWLMGNHQPRVGAGGESFWRRLRLLPFTVKVPDSKRVEGLAAQLADIAISSARTAAQFTSASNSAAPR